MHLLPRCQRSLCNKRCKSQLSITNDAIEYLNLDLASPFKACNIKLIRKRNDGCKSREAMVMMAIREAVAAITNDIAKKLI